MKLQRARIRPPSSLSSHAPPRVILPSSRSRSSTVCAASSGLLLLETDGVCIDTHMDGHRVAFNKALSDLGYDCAQFTPPIYTDLLAGGDGTAEGLVKAYFDVAGWPQMLPTSERPLFTRKICEGKAVMLTRMLKKDEAKLRSGLPEVLADALKDGFRIGLLSGTQSDNPEEIVASVLRQLGPEVGERVKVFYCSRGPGADGASGDDGPKDMNLALKEAAAKAKEGAAAQFVSSMKEGSGLVVDNQLLASNNSSSLVTPEYLAALTAALGARISDCLLLASSFRVCSAGCAAGMTTVAIPRKMAMQGSYPGVAAKLDGFGSGNATWTRLKSILQASSQASAK